ncbi:MAG: endonuclease/exonuclease/phosphatase family protein [Halioglobus sp.]
MTLNLHKGLGLFNRSFVLPAIRDAIRAVSADIVLLQEVVGEHTGFAGQFEDWPLESQYEFLADSTWQQFAYGKNAVADNSHHGNAVLSKYPIADWRNYEISSNTGEARGALHCQVAIPHVPERLDVVCVHLGLREIERQQQLNTLCDRIDKQVPAEAPMIVAGDFNDWRCRASRILRERLALSDVFSEIQKRPPRTYPVKIPMLRLDRIYSRNLVSKRPEVLSGPPWSRLSDHAALTVDIAL